MCVIASALMNEVGVTAGSVELEKMRQQCCNCQQSNRGTNAPTHQRANALFAANIATAVATVLVFAAVFSVVVIVAKTANVCHNSTKQGSNLCVATTNSQLPTPNAQLSAPNVTN